MEIYKQFASDLLQLLGEATALRIRCAGYMPLSIEDIGPDGEGRRQISICHYGEQNGDLMHDPEMIFTFHDGGTFLAAEPISYRDNYMGLNQECYICDQDVKRIQVRPDLRRSSKLSRRYGSATSMRKAFSPTRLRVS